MRNKLLIVIGAIVFLVGLGFFVFSFQRYQAATNYWGNNVWEPGYWLAPQNPNVARVELAYRIFGNVVIKAQASTDDKYYVIGIDSNSLVPDTDLSINIPRLGNAGNLIVTPSDSFTGQRLEPRQIEVNQFSSVIQNHEGSIFLEIAEYKDKDGTISYLDLINLFE